MKNKEEPSIGLTRGSPSSSEETAGSLSRPGWTASASIEKPALSLPSASRREAGGDASYIEPAPLTPLRAWTQILRRTAVCGPARTVVWGPGGGNPPGYPIRLNDQSTTFTVTR